MPLESCMLCVDNSEWMRNGDYNPSRIGSIQDAANLLCQTKIQSNHESTVGVLTMANKSVKVISSPTDQLGKLLAGLSTIPLGGKCDLISSIQVAQLALKHRKNQAGQSRIVLLIGSPVEAEDRAITKAGKMLRKNNIAIDILSIGEIEENESKLQVLVEAAKSTDNCHLVTVPAGVLPSDVMVSSPIFHGGEGGGGGGGGGGMGGPEGAAAGGGGGANAEFGGVDPSMDPELALALRVSMEEERARQAAAAASSSAPEGEPLAAIAEGEGEGEAASSAAGAGDAAATPAADSSAAAAAAAAAPATPAPAAAAGGGGDDDDLLAKALEMSMAAGAEDEDAAMELALQMSMQEDAGASSPPPAPAPTSPSRPPSAPAGAAAAPAAAAAPDAAAAAFLDPSFVNELLSGLPGVDPNDPKILAAMAQINSQGGSADSKKSGEEEKKEDEKK